MNRSPLGLSFLVLHLLGFVMATDAWAGPVYSIVVDGSDAIFLAGRTDLVIPPASERWNTGTFLLRHSSPTPEEVRETLPPFINVTGGDVVRVLDPAIGGVNFFNGFGPPFFGPSGSAGGISSLSSLGGISGYRGPQGPLAGIFLDDSIPNRSPAPPNLNFAANGLGTDFLTLSPLLRQVFYIGDGVTSGGVFQTFIAPAGATRLFLGIPDGFAFVGSPGAYDDDDGSYRVRVGVNAIPTISDVPEPSTLVLLGTGALTLVLMRRRVRKSAVDGNGR